MVWYAAAAGVMLMSTVAVAFHLLRDPARPTETTVPAPTPRAEAAQAEDRLTEETPANDTAETVDLPLAPRATAPSKGESAAEELRFLDRARQADARGEFSTVLAIAADHERRFPRGRLREEREVFRVRALIGLGRMKEAQASVERFHKQFPRSVLSRKIDDLLTSSR